MVATNTDTKARVMLAGAGQDMVFYTMQPPFLSDTRFFVTGFAVSWDTLLMALPQQKPELLLVHAGIGQLDALKNLLTTMQPWGGTALVVLPEDMAQYRGVFEAMPAVVSNVFVSPVSWGDLPNLAHSAVQTARARSMQLNPVMKPSSAGMMAQSSSASFSTPTLTGTKRIAVLSQSGGAGASTIAEALAYELAVRLSVKTLLFSLGRPPAAASHFKLRYVPNLSEFFARPGKPAIQAAIQKMEGLDILLAPEASAQYMAAAFGADDMRAANSIYSMLLAAEDGSYAAMVMDIAPDETAWMADPLIFANTILLVARPTLADLFVTRHTLNILLSGLGDHKFSRKSIFLVLNQASDRSSLTASEFQSELVAAIHWAPQIMAVINSDPAVLSAQEQRIPPSTRSDALARGARQVLASLFPGMDRGTGQSQSEGSSRATLKLPKIRFG